jgi:cytochrome c biogenesis protein CcdA
MKKLCAVATLFEGLFVSLYVLAGLCVIAGAFQTWLSQDYLHYYRGLWMIVAGPVLAILGVAVMFSYNTIGKRIEAQEILEESKEIGKKSIQRIKSSEKLRKSRERLASLSLPKRAPLYMLPRMEVMECDIPVFNHPNHPPRVANG